MIDGEISFKSLLYVTEVLEEMLGKNGANAILRTAGLRAAVNLIEMLPLSLPEEEAALRSGLILKEFGFIEELSQPDVETLKITGNHIIEEVTGLGLHGTGSARYYTIGLFEGFFKQMSGSTRKIISVELLPDGEMWKLGGVSAVG
jgi:hypothetical protein